MPVLRMFASFWITVVLSVGCFWVILAPTGATETNAAIAILASLATGWISWMVREQA